MRSRDLGFDFFLPLCCEYMSVLESLEFSFSIDSAALQKRLSDSCRSLGRWRSRWADCSVLGNRCCCIATCSWGWGVWVFCCIAVFPFTASVSTTPHRFSFWGLTTGCSRSTGLKLRPLRLRRLFQICRRLTRACPKLSEFSPGDVGNDPILSECHVKCRLAQVLSGLEGKLQAREILHEALT